MWVSKVEAPLSTTRGRLNVSFMSLSQNSGPFILRFSALVMLFWVRILSKSASWSSPEEYRRSISDAVGTKKWGPFSTFSRRCSRMVSTEITTSVLFHQCYFWKATLSFLTNGSDPTHVERLDSTCPDVCNNFVESGLHLVDSVGWNILESSRDSLLPVGVHAEPDRSR